MQTHRHLLIKIQTHRRKGISLLLPGGELGIQSRYDQAGFCTLISMPLFFLCKLMRIILDSLPGRVIDVID